MADPLALIEVQSQQIDALGPLSRLTTRLAARFDRARDRTVQNVP